MFVKRPREEGRKEGGRVRERERGREGGRKGGRGGGEREREGGETHTHRFWLLLN